MTESHSPLGYEPSVRSSGEILPSHEWHSLVEKEVKIAPIINRELSVIFIDIDKLKKVNDTFGHLPGNELIYNLQQTVLLMRADLRRKEDPDSVKEPDFMAHTRKGFLTESIETGNESVDMEVSRTGGDEYGIMCYTDHEGVQIVAERLRQKFDDNIDVRLKEIGVCISIGTATLKPNMTAKELLQIADAACYEDKLSHLKDLRMLAKKTMGLIFKLTQLIGVDLEDLPKYKKLRDQPKTV
jgi:GGDEF domain-containing protein